MKTLTSGSNDTLHSVDAWAGGCDRTPDGAYDASRARTSVAALVEQARAQGLVVVVSESGTLGSLARAGADAAVSVVRAALADAAEHAGVGGRVHVRFVWGAARLDLRIHTFAGPCGRRPGLDRGRALDGLDRRVADAGGRYGVEATAAGFLVRAYLPVVTEAQQLAG